MQRGKNLYFNVSITSRELQTSRFGLVLAGEVNVSVSGGERLGLVSVSSFYVSCPSLLSEAVKLAVDLKKQRKNDHWPERPTWARSSDH